MQKSVRVGDYFDNDDNGLWSWYLANIRNGDFEEFSRNKLKVTLLKRFLKSHFDPANNSHHQQNIKILFVSIPDKVHRDLPLLENFLRDYFHLEHLEHIQITKLTQSRIYSHENHYILIDKLNNFDDPTFLQFASPRWQQQITHQQSNRLSEKSATNDDPNMEINQKLYGTVTEHSRSSSSQSSSASSSIATGGSGRLGPQTVEVKSILSESTAGQPFDRNGQNSETDQDENDSIVLNFSHSLLRKQIEEKKMLAREEQQRKSIINPATKMNTHNESTDNTNNKYTTDTNNKYEKKTDDTYKEIQSPPMSESVSVDSCEDSMRDESDSVTDQETNYSGQPLSLTLTRNEDDTRNSSYSSLEDSVSDLSSVSRSLKSLGSATSFGEDNDIEDESDSDYSVLSILPSISITDALGHFRLVLQSSLLQNPETKEIYTAIRQSNNEPAIADVEDDWLLYDSHFSMNNIQLLTLQDLLDTNRSFPKIIFYSMIVVSDEEEQLQQLSNGRAVHKTSSQNTLQESSDDSLVPRINSNFSLSRDPQQFYPSLDDGDTSLSEQSGPHMYAPTRMQSNATTAHRSIRTVNSIGDWAFLHENERSANGNGGNGESGTEGAGTSVGSQGIQWVAADRTPSKNGLSKVSTMASLNPVERSKSTPLPVVLRSFSNMDGEGKHWKDKINTWRKKSHKDHSNDKGCIVM